MLFPKALRTRSTRTVLVSCADNPARARRMVLTLRDVDPGPSILDQARSALEQVHLPELPNVHLPQLPNVHLPQLPDVRLPQMPDLKGLSSADNRSRGEMQQTSCI